VQQPPTFIIVVVWPSDEELLGPDLRRFHAHRMPRRSGRRQRYRIQWRGRRRLRTENPSIKST
jgi:hypothetical protein